MVYLLQEALPDRLPWVPHLLGFLPCWFLSLQLVGLLCEDGTRPPVSGTRLVGTGVCRGVVWYTLTQARTPALTPSRTHLHGLSGAVTGCMPFLGLCGFLCHAPPPPRPWQQRLPHRDGECPPATFTAPAGTSKGPVRGCPLRGSQVRREETREWLWRPQACVLGC